LFLAILGWPNFAFSPAVRHLVAATQIARFILIVRIGRTNKQQTPSFELDLLAYTYILLNFQEKFPLSCYRRQQKVFRLKISFRKIA
jgi:hypothetical protein